MPKSAHQVAIAVSLLVFTFCLTQSSWAKPPARFKINSGGLLLQPAAEKHGDAFNPQMAGNSRTANMTLWPSSFLGTALAEGCSATAIGPHSILTAAHCVGDGKAVRIQRDGAEAESGICTQIPQFAQDTSADYALCFMTQTVAASRYETVALASDLAAGRELLATGYGCRMVGGKMSDQLAIGPVWIQSTPGYDHDYPDYAATGYSKNSAFLCEGDSGGSTFIGTEDGPRTVVAVNSGWNDTNNTSYLAALSTPDAISFLNSWATKPDHGICGVTPGLAPCKMAATTP